MSPLSPLPVRARVARAFHEEYELLAKAYGWTTQEESRVDWDDVPVRQKALMCNVIGNLETSGIIEIGPNV